WRDWYALPVLRAERVRRIGRAGLEDANLERTAQEDRAERHFPAEAEQVAEGCLAVSTAGGPLRPVALRQPETGKHRFRSDSGGNPLAEGLAGIEVDVACLDGESNRLGPRRQ